MLKRGLLLLVFIVLLTGAFGAIYEIPLGTEKVDGRSFCNGQCTSDNTIAKENIYK